MYFLYIIVQRPWIVSRSSCWVCLCRSTVPNTVHAFISNI